MRQTITIPVSAATRLLSGAAFLAASLCAQLAFAPAASAKPPAPAAFCKSYPDSRACATGFAECTTCHTVAPARNAFGAQLSERITPGASRPLADDAFVAALPGALKAIEGLDADGDGFSNIAEILAGTQTANAESIPRILACAADQATRAGEARWNVCQYDPDYAFRKVHLDFCGRSPNRAEMDAFRRMRGNETAWRVQLSSALDTCLNSRYWLGKEGVVWNLANAKIRPAHTVKSGADAGPVPLGDYEDDYNLFTYNNSDDRDVRGLLLAQYYVKRTSDDPVTLEVIPEEELAKRTRATSQNVPKDKRVGMLTTRWVAAVNTMFTAVPRTTAAQAYRSYLGFDVAKMQGLMSAPHEPADYDIKGVGAPQCAVCHATLDPLSYPFTRYNGIGRYNYDANRLKDFIRSDGPKVVEAPEKGVIFGTEVKDLLEWGQVAANSDAFATKVVFDYWKLLVGREPSINDQAEFTALWRGLKASDTYNYRVEKMLHGLILTNAYGRP